ncbi:MAG TPA: hypothetical protein VL147_01730 [Devosia sp.]|nr:hypothetical protein [Devosia sp.]
MDREGLKARFTSAKGVWLTDIRFIQIVIVVTVPNQIVFVVIVGSASMVRSKEAVEVVDKSISQQWQSQRDRSRKIDMPIREV